MLAAPGPTPPQLLGFNLRAVHGRSSHALLFKDSLGECCSPCEDLDVCIDTSALNKLSVRMRGTGTPDAGCCVL